MTVGEPDRSPDVAGSETDVALAEIPLHSTTLLTVLDEEGIIQYESPSIERIYGYDQDELVGEQVASYFHPDDRSAVVDAFEAVVRSDSYAVETVEYRHETADGTYCWVESVAAANPTSAGHYVINTRDISERKAQEEELLRTNERLDEFASAVGHDLRNPLNVAQLELALAAEECDSEHLDGVARAHERMETLIEDLLAVARAGAQVRETEPVDLRAICAACWHTVATGEATVAVETDRSIRADRSRLKQVLSNLMRNAVEHGSTSRVDAESTDAVERGGEGVHVRIGVRDDERGFYVADDGPGIPECRRQRVFESGYSTGKDGTGLGLTIVQDIAEAHGWRVQVSESSDGGVRIDFVGVAFE